MAENNVVELVVKVTDAATEQLKSINNSVNNLASGVGGLSLQKIGLFGTMIGALKEAKEGFSELITESSGIQDATVRLDRLFRAFGDTLGVSRGQLQRFTDGAKENSRFSNIAIIEMQSTLLKFGTITGDTFKRAEQASLDLGAYFKDLSQGAYIVGRSLAAPEQSTRLLRQAGVILDPVQKEQIKNFEALGDKAGAANIILTEIEKRFNGSAAEDVNTLSGAWAHLKNTFDELFQNSGILATFVGLINDLNGALSKTPEAMLKVQLARLEASKKDGGGFASWITGGTSSIDRDIAQAKAQLAEFDKARKAAASDDERTAAKNSLDSLANQPNVNKGQLPDFIETQLKGFDELSIRTKAAAGSLEDYYTEQDKANASAMVFGATLDGSAGASDALNETLHEGELQLKQTFKAAVDASNAQIKMFAGIQDAFTRFFLSTSGGFKGLLRNFVDMLRQMAAEAISAKLMDSIFGSVTTTGGRSGGGWWDALVKGVAAYSTGGASAATGNAVSEYGQFAAGGDGSPGVKLVGEEGPEVMATGAARFFNARQLGFAGGGGAPAVHFAPVTNIVMQPKDGDTQSLRTEFYSAMDMNNKKLKRDMYDTLDRNGLGKMR